MIIKLIVATSSKETGYAIGKGNKLLWECKEDLKYFQRCTTGHAVVYGRKTFDSINEVLGSTKGLPNRKNIVISRKKHMSFMSVGSPLWVTSPERAVKFIEATPHYKDLWVCGGCQIYKEMLPNVLEVHHTTITGIYEAADTHFSMDFLDNGEWKLHSVEKLCEEATVRVWRRYYEE